MVEHMCERCGKVFKTKYTLTRHMNGKRMCKVKHIDFTDESKVIVRADDINLDADYEIVDDLETFNFSEKFEADQCYSMILAAIRRSGKTTLIKYIYPMLFKQYDFVIFLSNSIHNKIYSFVKGLKFKEYTAELIDDIMAFQEKTGNLFRWCIIMDDLVSYRNKNDDSLMQLYVRGRNVNITVIVSSQSTTLINKNNRGNSDYVVIGNNPSAEYRETVIKAFLLGAVKIPKAINTKNSRMDYLHKYILFHTKNYGFLIMDNISHKIYKFKTPMNKKS